MTKLVATAFAINDNGIIPTKPLPPMDGTRHTVHISATMATEPLAA